MLVNWPLCIASAWQITLFHSTDIERIYGCEMPRRFEVLRLCWPCCVTWLKYIYCLQRLKSFGRGRWFKSYVCMCRRLWLQSQTLDFHEQEVCSRYPNWRRTTPIKKLQKVVIIQNNFSGKDRREIHCNVFHVV